MRFTKMQGIGNDYVYVDCRAGLPKNPQQLARRISDRHLGVGSDGLVLICPGEGEADFRMRMFNSDGSESEMCGNAVRCVGRYVYEKGLTDKTELTIATGAGPIGLTLQVEGGQVVSVTADMGIAVTEPVKIPVNTDLLPYSGVRVQALPLQVGEETFRVTCVSTGNPHCVLFVADVDTAPVHTVGPLLEHHPLFPARTNVEFAQVVDRGHIRLRVWERGAGETLACGTGACATLVAAVMNELTEKEAEIALPGGTLQVRLDERGRLHQTGPATFVFEGEWPDEDEGEHP